MDTFSLQIVTPDRTPFSGEAVSVLVRTVTGDVEVLAHHADLLCAVGTGRAKVKTEAGERLASCSGGFLSVTGGSVCLAVTTFEFADEIDLDRANAAKERAQAALQTAADEAAIAIAKAKLSRALNRIRVAQMR